MGHGAGMAGQSMPQCETDNSSPVSERAKSILGSSTRRPNARDEIRELQAIYALRINQLDALSRALPNEVPFVADEGLRALLARERGAIVYFS